MAAAQSSTIHSLGRLAEMEDEVRRPELASSIARNSGGGQKRKREEEPRVPIFVSRRRRLGMLDSIVCVLKCFNAVIRFHVPADGDMGFRLETGSVEEQRMAGLIYSHVCSYILLYLLEKEKKKTRKDSSDPSSSHGETFKLPAKGKVLPLMRKVDPLLCEFECLDRTFTLPLVDGRRALVDGPTLRHGDVNIGTTEFDQLRDYNKGRRKQELLDVLHTLEVIGHARGYAPPADGREILVYKEIRKQIAYYTVHVQARPVFLEATGEKMSDYPRTLSDPFSAHQGRDVLNFIPPLHRLQVSFEQMHEHLAILKECKQRVAHLLSPAPTPLSDRVRDLVAIVRAKDAARSGLLTWKPRKASFPIPLSECLDRIIHILGRIRSLGEQTPNEKEARMYALIGEHVRSSIWLSESIELSQRAEKRSRVVYFDNESDAQGKHLGTQEQLLEQIMTYLRAFKSSCLDDVPSFQESMKYGEIWMMLNPALLVPPEDVAEPGEISAAELPMLELKLCCIYKRALAFIGVVKEELCSIAAVVHSALQPEVHLTPEGALCWFTAREDDAATKAKEFVVRSLSLGGIANLDHALLVLAELGAIGLFFFRLSYAVSFVDWAWRDAKKYATVASEVESALGVICSEKPFGYSGDSTVASEMESALGVICSEKPFGYSGASTNANSPTVGFGFLYSY